MRIFYGEEADGIKEAGDVVPINEDDVTPNLTSSETTQPGDSGTVTIDQFEAAGSPVRSVGVEAATDVNSVYVGDAVPTTAGNATTGGDVQGAGTGQTGAVQPQMLQ